MERRVADARVARLATIGGDSRPHIVPICFALADGQIVTALDRKPKSTPALRRFDNVRARGAASLLVDHYDEDWAQLWWVRVDGSARVVEDGADLDHAIDALREKYRGQYGLDPPSGPAIVLDPDTWVGWSATERPD